MGTSALESGIGEWMGVRLGFSWERPWFRDGGGCTAQYLQSSWQQQATSRIGSHRYRGETCQSHGELYACMYVYVC